MTTSQNGKTISTSNTEPDELTARLAQVTAELEVCQAERDELQLQLQDLRSSLRSAHEQVSEIGRAAKALIGIGVPPILRR